MFGFFSRKDKRKHHQKQATGFKGEMTPREKQAYSLGYLKRDTMAFDDAVLKKHGKEALREVRAKRNAEKEAWKDGQSKKSKRNNKK
ncbi:MAG: hypothetical protein FWB72_05950 [Firmicutes bacterium]|nr:hypothetical protein [Bacillota bacterium]